MVLKVNGEELAPAKAMPRGAYRASATYEWRLPLRATQAGELTLELEVTNAWRMSTWFDTTPRLVPSRRGDLQTDLVRISTGSRRTRVTTLVHTPADNV